MTGTNRSQNTGRQAWLVRLSTALAAGSLLLLTGCGREEPDINTSHRSNQTEINRFDAMRENADAQSPFDHRQESPHEANARDMQSMEGDADFHTQAEVTSPINHNPTK